jgi:hypothetical protein
MLNSFGTCQQFEHIKILEKSLFSLSKISIFISHSPILKDKLKLSFNLFVSEEFKSE